MKKSLLFLIAITLTLPCTAALLHKTNAVPGGIHRESLGVSGENAPLLYYNAHRVAVLKNTKTNTWDAVIGVPLFIKPGQSRYLMVKPKRAYHPFVVGRKNYVVQRLTIKNTNLVTPNKKSQKRIQQERRSYNEYFQTYTWHNPFEQAFISPLRGRISSLFGLRRVYNGIPRRPHSGLDIAAPRGTPIVACADGTVIATGNYFYTGKTVLLDHGRGLISLYGHMNSIGVKTGDTLKQGARLGTVGSTGRATGPHLHWTIVLNGARIDPLLFVSRQQVKPLAKKVKITAANQPMSVHAEKH